MKIPTIFLLFGLLSLIPTSDSRILPGWFLEKPGRCPNQNEEENEELQCMAHCEDEENCINPCPFICRDDRDCQEDLKCCLNGLYRRCKAPVQIIPESDSRRVKPGKCPRYRSAKVPCKLLCKNDRKCISRCPVSFDHIPGCKHDGECKGAMKCCHVGFSRQCMHPYVYYGRFKNKKHKKFRKIK